MKSRRFWLIGTTIALFALGTLGAYADAVYTAPQTQPQAPPQAAQPQAQAADGVMLRYKFVQGELLRYKMKMTMNMNMVMAGKSTAMPMTMTGVYRMRTVKVFPNGDAEVRAAIESMKSMMNGKELPIKASQLPVFSFIMSSRGEMKQMKAQNGDMMGMAGNPFGGMTGMQGSSPVFPENGVKVGDAWSQDSPLPFANGGPLSMDGKITNQFLLTTMSNSAASIQQYSTGKFQMKMDAGANGGNITSDGDLNMKGTQTFSVQKGHLVGTNVSGTTHIVTAIPNSNNGSIAMDIQMTVKMDLIQ